MLDLTRQKWDFGKVEEYALKWLEEHSFDVVLKKQYLSKTVFEITKYGETYLLEIPHGVKDEKSFMEEVAKSFDLYCKCQKANENQ